MRMILLAAAGLVLAGCASTGTTGSSEYEKLSADCKARGGILKPIPGATDSNEAANYACEIIGGSVSKPGSR